jgi:GTP cyclohydrolase II
MSGIPAPTVEKLLKENEGHRCPGDEVCVKIAAIADLPTLYGEYQVVAFWNNFDGKEHAAFVHGDIFEKEEVPVRLHSECLTGDAIGSLRCDCREQLVESLKRIGKMEKGIVLYMRQEGRGIGFANKIRAYQLQDKGYDTLKANELLGFKPDERDYDLAAHMLGSLHVKSVKLLTNNPAKINDLQLHGVKITSIIPVVVPPNKYNRFYLETKKNKAGHLLDTHRHEILLEQPDELVDYHHTNHENHQPSDP